MPDSKAVEFKLVVADGLGRMRRARPVGRIDECIRVGSRALIPDKNFWMRASTSLCSLRGSSLTAKIFAAIVFLG